MPTATEPTAEEIKAESDAKAAAALAAEAPKPGEETASYLENLMHGERRKEKKVEAKLTPEQEEKKKKDDEAAAAKAAKDKTDKATAAKKKVAKPVAKESVAPPAEPDYDKIAEATARGMATALAKKDEAKVAEVPDDLSSEEREFYEAYSQMEKDYPEDKGIAKRYLESLKAADAFEEKWLEKNPDKDISEIEEDPEYKAFIEKNAIRYSEIRLHKSLAKLESAKAVKESKGETDKELNELRKKETQREAVPKIIARRADSARSFFDTLGEKFKDVLDDKGNINGAEIKKLSEADELNRIAFATAQDVEGFAGELYQLMHGLMEFDDKNPVHAHIGTFVTENEDYLAGLTRDEQAEFVDKLPESLQTGKTGKRYATSAQYAKLPKEERGKYYRLSDADMAHLYAVSQAENAKSAIAAEEKRLETLATKRGWKKVEPDKEASEAAAKAAAKAKETPAPSPSPSGAIEPRPALPAGGGNGANKNAADSFSSSFLG